jgi:hypothetical protein
MADDGGGDGGGDKPNALPSLQNLNLANMRDNEHNTTVRDENNQLPEGFLCLDKHAIEKEIAERGISGPGCKSAIYLIRNAVQYDGLEKELKAMADFMENAVPVEIKQGKVMHRKQCTFGALYKGFGQSFTMDDSRLPSDVKAFVNRLFSGTIGLIAKNAAVIGVNTPERAKEIFTGVHCNFYRDGKANVPAHQDDEPDLDPTMPIFSYTFLTQANEKGDDVQPRKFKIYRNKAPWQPGVKSQKGDEVGSVFLGNGDLLVMVGEMQKYFWHEVPVTNNKIYNNTQRLNFTVRAFTMEAVQKAKALAAKAAKAAAEAEAAAAEAEAAAKAVAEVVPMED